MKRTSLILAAVLLTGLMLFSGCGLGKIVDAIKNQKESSTAETITETTAEKTVETETETATETETETETEPVTETETETETEIESETETETESETETETETEPEPEEDEIPITIRMFSHSIEQYDYDEEGAYLGMMTTSFLKIAEEYQEEFDKLHTVLGLDYMVRDRECQKLREKLKDAAKENEGNSTSTDMLTTVRMDSSILSYCIETTVRFAGANRSNTVAETFNLDSQTGTVLGLSDVVADEKALLAALKGSLRETLSQYEEEIPGISDEADYFLEDIAPEELLWNIGYDRIIFFLEGGDILPEGGVFRTEVLFSGNEKIFTKKALNVPEEYIITLRDEGYYGYCDSAKAVLSDGRTLEVQIESDSAEGTNTLNVSIDGNISSARSADFSIVRLFLLHRANAEYLYVMGRGFHARPAVCVFDVSNDDPEYISWADEGIGESFYTEYAENEYGHTFTNIREMPSDPSCFLMGKSGDLLSSEFFSRSYTAGEDGIPISSEYWRSGNQNIELTLLQELEVDIVDADTDVVTGKKLLEPGDVITIWRGNLEDRIVECKTEDGEVIMLMLEFDSEAGVIRVKRISVFELFEGMQYTDW